MQRAIGKHGGNTNSLAALITARMMNANKNALGWILGEGERPFSHQGFAGWWLVKAGLRGRFSLMQVSRGEQVNYWWLHVSN